MTNQMSMVSPNPISSIHASTLNVPFVKRKGTRASEATSQGMPGEAGHNN